MENKGNLGQWVLLSFVACGTLETKLQPMHSCPFSLLYLKSGYIHFPLFFIASFYYPLG